MGAAADDLLRVIGLGVHGVGDEQDPVQAARQALQGVEQRRERRDLVALRVDGDLGQDDAGTGVQRGQQMGLPAAGQAGTP